MVETVPGAAFRPISVNYTDRARAYTRAIIFHATGVAGKTSQFSWFNNPNASASSHIDLARDGTFEQYVSSELIAWASGEANSTAFSVEMENTGNEELTPEQMGTVLYLIQWAHAKYGFPIREMSNSATSERGVGWHRLGTPYRYDKNTGTVTAYREGWYEAGTELWSKVSGKTCPGDKVISQLKQLINLAANAGDYKFKIGVFMHSPMAGRFTSGYRTSARPTHEGVDIAPPVAGTVGSQVVAAFGGRVVRAVSGRVHDRSSRQALNAGKPVLAPGRSGNGVIIQNPDGEFQCYNHVTPSVTVGQVVSAGGAIGKTDRSGNQSGPHLHFETWGKSSTPARPVTFNPQILFDKYGIKIGAEISPVSTYVSVGDVSVGDQARLAQVTSSSGTIFYTGLLDGRGGPMWDRAVRLFQSENGLLVDGDFGNLSRKKFDTKYAEHFKAVQTKLRNLKKPDGNSYYGGNIDGIAGKMTYDSVKSFQSDNGLVADANWGAITDARYWVVYNRQNAKLPAMPDAPPEIQPEVPEVPEDVPTESPVSPVSPVVPDSSEVEELIGVIVEGKLESIRDEIISGVASELRGMLRAESTVSFRFVD